MAPRARAVFALFAYSRIQESLNRSASRSARSVSLRAAEQGAHLAGSTEERRTVGLCGAVQQERYSTRIAVQELMGTDADTGFVELLQRLGLEQYIEVMKRESIVGPSDLALLSKDDCQELGLSLGERNRVLRWAEQWNVQQQDEGDTAGSQLAAELAARVRVLAEDVAERESWIAASLDAAEMAKRAEEARRRRSQQVPVNVRTRIAPAQVKARAKQEARKRKKRKVKAAAKPAVAVLANALFANAGSARRVGFAIDISGSMHAGAFGDMNRLDVVKKHLRGAITSMQGAFNAAFSIVLFDTECHTPMGSSLTPANWTGVKKAEECINAMQPGGGNGGEAACMRALLKMRPQAIFFLGDGGWSETELIAAAGEAKSQDVVVHSIAFFTSGGGLPEIAQITGGTYREINGEGDLDELPAARDRSSKPVAGGVLPDDEESSGSSDETDDDSGADSSLESGSESSDEE